MDASKEPHQGEEEHPESYLSVEPSPLRRADPPLPTGRRSSLESEHSELHSDAESDLLSSDMDRHGDAYRRRKAQLMAERNNGSIEGRKSKRKSNYTISGDGVRPSPYSTANGHESDFSSVTTSEDVEMDPLESEEGLTDDEEAGLTKKDRQHRKRRRRKHADLDARVGGSSRFSDMGEKVADRNVVKAMILNVMLILSWYFFSLSISIYNKWMFSEKYLNFHFPLFTTCVHMLVQFGLASLVLYFVPRLRPRTDSISNPRNHAHVRRDSNQPEKPLMTPMFYFTRIGPCGAATGLDIGLGNMSLKFITLTFYTMCKSSSLTFVLCFAFLFRLESPSLKLILIIAFMTIGVLMMVAGETAFNLLGFVLVILAAFFSGFRWSLTQILLLRSPATSNPFSSIFFLAPIMFVTLAIIAVPVEGLFKLGEGLADLVEIKGALPGTCILLFPGLLAFLMTASEFALLQRTSVVTLSICGIFKEVVTISAAGIVFHDPLTPINITGLLVTIASIMAYNYIKIMKMRNDARTQADGPTSKDFEGESSEGDEGGEATEPMLAPLRDPRAESLRASDGGSRSGSRASLKSSREND